jgi:hypothetical protein
MDFSTPEFETLQRHWRQECPNWGNRYDRFARLLKQGKSVKAAAKSTGMIEVKPMDEATKQMLRDRAADERAAQPKRKRRRKARKR